MQDIQKKFHQGAQQTNFTKTLPNLIKFNPCPFSPSVATDDKKQFQYLNMVLNNQTSPFFWNSIDANTLLNFLKGWQIA